MGKEVTPLFHNDMGAEVIEVGVRHFGCMGASAPMDHPHVYLEMGATDEAVCPYCSTRFRYNAGLGETESRPVTAPGEESEGRAA